MITPKPQTLCAHYKTNGEQCEAVALTNERFCFFHIRDRQRAAVIDRAYATRARRILNGGPANEVHSSNAFTHELFNETSASLIHSLEIPVLEDGNAIQITVTNLLRAIGAGLIDLRAAGLMLYGLQLASGTLSRVRTEPFTSRPKAIKAPDPLRQIALAVTELREKRKAAATAAVAEMTRTPNENDKSGTED